MLRKEIDEYHINEWMKMMKAKKNQYSYYNQPKGKRNADRGLVNENTVQLLEL